MSEAPKHPDEIDIPIRSAWFEGKELRYRTPNALTRWRVDTLLREEPDTIRWLSCMEEGDVLVDIGANVGMYSTLAATARGVRVFAFEPESQNYSLLNQNIYLNGVADKVTAYCTALSDQSGLSMLYLGQMDAGGAFHASGEALDFNLEPLRAPFAQGCILSTLDELVDAGTVPVPSHIKLDVDGFEYKVVNGMLKTIRHPDVKSVAIELNPNLPEHREIFEQMALQGFHYFDNQWAESCPEDGPFKGIGNVIFYRPSWPKYEALYERQVGPMRVARSMAAFVERINAAPVKQEPVPHVIIDNAFLADFYANLVNNVTVSGLLERLDNNPQVDLNKELLNELPGSEAPFWDQLIDALTDNGFLRTIVEKACSTPLNSNTNYSAKLYLLGRRHTKTSETDVSHRPLVSLSIDLTGSNFVVLAAGPTELELLVHEYHVASKTPPSSQTLLHIIAVKDI